ncbi:MAG TPA: hypothetical protein VE912_00885 [Bacteroidales bacterium]|nr:hypothetical protein [Bacteroidales bacterium]
MERFFYILVIIGSNFISSFCQTAEPIVYTINYQWIKFYSNDTIYSFTLYTEQNGLFHFETGFADSIENPKPKFYTLIEDDNTIIYERNFQFNQDVKIITDQFPQFDKRINTYEILELSYLLNEINKNPKDNSEDYINILFPCDQTNFYNEIYYLKVEKGNISPIIYVQKLASKDINGLSVVNEEHIKIKQKDFKKLEKRLKIIADINDVFCTDSNNSFFLEFKLNSTIRRHILTSYCGEKQSGRVLKTYFRLLSLINSYTDLDCSRELKNLVPKSF